jgi:hypothetical protein
VSVEAADGLVVSLSHRLRTWLDSRSHRQSAATKVISVHREGGGVAGSAREGRGRCDGRGHAAVGREHAADGSKGGAALARRPLTDRDAGEPGVKKNRGALLSFV